jgi:hypothetical protein
LSNRFPRRDQIYGVVSRPLVSDRIDHFRLTFPLKRQPELINVTQRGECGGYSFFFERRDAAAIDDCAT